jgi:hypothetical protein
MKSASESLAAVARAQAARDESRRVLLRVRHVAYATPGIYPILKSHEKPSKCTDAPDYVLLPYRPFTVIAFNVRRQVQVELVTPRSGDERDPGKKDNGDDATFKPVKSAIESHVKGKEFEFTVDSKKARFRVLEAVASRLSMQGANAIEVACKLERLDKTGARIRMNVLEDELNKFLKEQKPGAAAEYELSARVSNPEVIDGAPGPPKFARTHRLDVLRGGKVETPRG